MLSRRLRISNPADLPAMEKTNTNSLEEERSEIEDNGQTIRPSRSPSAAGPMPLPPIGVPPAVEDWSDLAAEEDMQKLEDKVAGLKVCGWDDQVADQLT